MSTRMPDNTGPAGDGHLSVVMSMDPAGATHYPLSDPDHESDRRRESFHAFALPVGRDLDIGRGTDVSIVLHTAMVHLHRRHVILRNRGDGTVSAWVQRKEGRLNGQPVENENLVLRPGDTIALGIVGFTVRVGSPDAFDIPAHVAGTWMLEWLEGERVARRQHIASYRLALGYADGDTETIRTGDSVHDVRAELEKPMRDYLAVRPAGDGALRVNGEYTRGVSRLFSGDRVEVDSHRLRLRYAAPGTDASAEFTAADSPPKLQPTLSVIVSFDHEGTTHRPLCAPDHLSDERRRPVSVLPLPPMGRLTIGSQSTASFHIPHPVAPVAPQHVILHNLGDGRVLAWINRKDARVNGEAPGSEALILSPEDTIAVGGSRLHGARCACGYGAIVGV